MLEIPHEERVASSAPYDFDRLNDLEEEVAKIRQELGVIIDRMISILSVLNADEIKGAKKSLEESIIRAVEESNYSALTGVAVRNMYFTIDGDDVNVEINVNL